MINSKPFKLSICIPTFNRYKSLKVLLAMLIEQIHAEDVQIVVGNNASTDKTDELCKLYATSNMSFKYIKHDINLGFSKNVESVVKNADGEYLWILGDDDIPNDQAIKQILSATNEHKVGWLLFNFIRNNEEEFKKFTESDICNLNNLLKKAGIWSSFMSISVLKKDALQELEKIPKNNYYAFSLALNAGANQDVAYKDFNLVERKISEIAAHRFNESSTYAVDFFEYLDKLVSLEKVSFLTRNMLAKEFFLGIISLYLIKNKLYNKSNPRFIDLFKRHKYVFVFYFTIVPIYVSNTFFLKLAISCLKALNGIYPKRRFTKAINFLDHE